LHLEKITDGNCDTAAENQEVARQRSLLLLYARYVCFRVFLECAAAMPGGITEDHKLRWLLIQVAPETLLGPPTFFRNARGWREQPPPTISREILHKSLSASRSFYRNHLPCFACSMKRRFLQRTRFLPIRSPHPKSDKSPEPRPILREILSSWSPMLPNLIVSGTGISMQEVDRVIGSVVAKEGGDHQKR
jgi:hypothetical protein